MGLRLDTARDILCGADVLPIFTLELLETRALLLGSDVLAGLAVHPEEGHSVLGHHGLGFGPSE